LTEALTRVGRRGEQIGGVLRQRNIGRGPLCFSRWPGRADGEETPSSSTLRDGVGRVGFDFPSPFEVAEHGGGQRISPARQRRMAAGMRPCRRQAMDGLSAAPAARPRAQGTPSLFLADASEPNR